MINGTFLTAALVLLILALEVSGAQSGGAPRRTLDVGGISRSYLLHVPRSYDKSRPSPLILLFHGAGGTGATLLERFRDYAQSNRAILACPDGINGRWNAGLEDEIRQTGAADDVKFAAALIDAVCGEYSIDAQRIYAAGFSNGAALSIRLGLELPQRLAAVAAVSATMPAHLAGKLAPDAPPSVLLIVGEDDALFGKESKWVASGAFLSAAQTTRHWGQLLGAAPDPSIDVVPGDSRAQRTTYSNLKTDQQAVLIWVPGLAHRWPAESRLPATRLIGDFFTSHIRPQSK